jgi:pimeloyl-ACP methyl ester carboxylesterase
MKIHIVAHSMGGAVPLLFSNELYSSIISFANLEGNLIGADCEMLSRVIANAGYEKYRDELFEKQKKDFAEIDELKFDETTPSAMYFSAKSLVEWSDNGRLLEKFKSLKCKKAYFYGEKNKSMEALNELNGIEKIMISNSGHSMMLENHVDFYTKLYKFIFG